jgi:hypothetical protein
MAFVRRKTINGKDKFYLVENKRVDGKVRQKVLAYLGESDTVEGAIAELEDRIERFRFYAKRQHEGAAKFREKMHPSWLQAGEVPPRRRKGGQFFTRLINRYWGCVEYGV